MNDTPTPRTDADRIAELERELAQAQAECDSLQDKHAFSLKELERGNVIIDELRTERDAIRAEVRGLQELNAHQLAACDCAAMMDTEATHAQNKDVIMGNPAWSPAFDSVMRRTAECIKLRAEVATLKQAFTKQQHEITQPLGKALGYPWYKDDQKNFPNATEADGVFVGEHVAESIATEAARKIEELRAEVAELQSKLSNAHIETKAIDALYREMADKILPREEEIIRLRAEVERLKHNLDTLNWMFDLNPGAAYAKIRDLTIEVERLREDKARLDWFGQFGDHIYGQLLELERDNTQIIEWQFDIGGATEGSEVVNIYGSGKTLRDAIDAARNAARKEQP